MGLRHHPAICRRVSRMWGIVIPAVTSILCSCTVRDADIVQLNARIDSLHQLISQSYKPGFGDVMTSVQIHHAKLWYAGMAGNWELAEFELHEIDESLEKLKTFQAGRKETALLNILTPSMTTVTEVVKAKDVGRFKEAFRQLTQACNDCHRAANFEFNVVQVPDTPPFSNQSFQ